MGYTDTVAEAGRPHARPGCIPGSSSPWQPPAPLARAEADRRVGKNHCADRWSLQAKVRSSTPLAMLWGRWAAVWGSLAKGSLVSPSSADALKRGPHSSGREMAGEGLQAHQKKQLLMGKAAHSSPA